MQKGKEGLLLQEKEKFVEKLSEIFFLKRAERHNMALRKKRIDRKGKVTKRNGKK